MLFLVITFVVRYLVNIKIPLFFASFLYSILNYVCISAEANLLSQCGYLPLADLEQLFVYVCIVVGGSFCSIRDVERFKVRH